MMDYDDGDGRCMDDDDDDDDAGCSVTDEE
jgi:hypothetical protein